MIYIAMLRGINVGAHKRMKMERLRVSCETLGFEQIATYIQSGNVVFKAPKLSPASLSEKIEKRIAADFGFEADVITRTREEFKKMVRTNPLLRKRAWMNRNCTSFFLQECPVPKLSRNWNRSRSPDRVRVIGKEIYFYFPNGVSGSSLWKHNLDRVLSISGTMRNWNTVNKLLELA